MKKKNKKRSVVNTCPNNATLHPRSCPTRCELPRRLGRPAERSERVLTTTEDYTLTSATRAPHKAQLAPPPRHRSPENVGPVFITDDADLIAAANLEPSLRNTELFLHAPRHVLTSTRSLDGDKANSVREAPFVRCRRLLRAKVRTGPRKGNRDKPAFAMAPTER